MVWLFKVPIQIARNLLFNWVRFQICHGTIEHTKKALLMNFGHFFLSEMAANGWTICLFLRHCWVLWTRSHSRDNHMHWLKPLRPDPWTTCLRVYRVNQFWGYAGQPHNHIGWAMSMPFASINPTNSRTDLWNFRRKISRIGDFEKRPFWKIGHFEK